MNKFYNIVQNNTLVIEYLRESNFNFTHDEILLLYSKDLSDIKFVLDKYLKDKTGEELIEMITMITKITKYLK